MPMGTVLVVEDDTSIRKGVVDTLTFAGYRAIEAKDGREGLSAAFATNIDIILLDILMPHVDGLTVLKEVRASRPTLPIIMLTARGEDSDVVTGLKLGADDYVVKPFSATQLLARIEAVLRRSAERPTHLNQLCIAGITIDFERRELTQSDGTKIVLPQRESEVLSYLAAHRGRAISRDELLKRVWGVDPRGVRTRTVDMTIARLREQLGDDPTEPRVIVTVRGRGYMLIKENESETNAFTEGTQQDSA
ncbi:MAG: response regulator transcription factor [Phycisphaeraceae bacterium]|nr:response regulator transcription factor [Phycisphaerales bacterium]MCB9859295.1 response regulator transcription factor [Phycisphaeraceae bacterium]